MSRRPLWALAAVALICACSSAEREAQTAVKQQLTDPESAQFRNLSEHEAWICGEVNSKNRLGGYVGFRIFIYGKSGESVVIDPQEYLTPQAKEVFGEIANMVTDTAAFDQRWAAECAS